MNEKYPVFGRRVTGLIVLALASSTGLFAQNASEEDDNIYELNPFSVQENETVGYQATTTLAGTRIKSQLRDIAASISVLTQEFIEDTGSTNIADLLVYAVGMEVDGINGNFTSATETGNFGTFEFSEVALTNQTTTRVRGLANADRTRNYFGSIIPMDTYNVDRVDINRGANNILFGLGSPAGIVNQGLSQPLTVDRNRLRLQTDDNGTFRSSFDFNRVFADEKVRLRIMGLHNDQKFQQDPAYQKEQRIFGALDINLTKTTLLRINAEFGDMTSTPPVNGPPRDRFTNWWDLGKPILVRGQDFRDRQDGLAGQTIDGTPLPGAVTPLIVFDGSTPNVALTPISSVPMPNPNLDLANFDAVNPARQTSFRPLFTTMNDDARRIRLAGSGLPGDLFVSSPQIQDPSVFDFRNQLLDGRNSKKWHDIEAHNISLQQTFFEGNAGIELSYDKQEFDSGWFNLLDGGFRTTSINLDINEALTDGTTNPNIGRPFISGMPQWSQSKEERETKRALLYANFDIEEHWGNIGKWLGEHTFTALFEENVRDDMSYGGPGMAMEHGYGVAAGMSANQARFNSGLQTGFWQYLDASKSSFLGESSPAGANIQKYGDYVEFPSSIESIYIQGDGSFTRGNFSVLNWEDNQDTLTTGSALSQIEVNSTVFALQSKFLSDNLVTTVGWRKDKNKKWVAGTLTGTEFQDSLGTHDLSGLKIDSDDLVIDIEDETFSWGAVYHVPESILSRDTGMGVSFNYNQSENFNPNETRPSPIGGFGSQFAPPFGESTDYGVTLELMDGKFFVKGTWYETNQNLSPDTGPANPYNWYFRNIPTSVYAWNSTADIAAAGFELPSQGVQDAYGYQFRDDPDRPGFRILETEAIGAGDITQTISEGFELELLYNPNSNVRLFFNAAKQEAIKTGIAQTAGPEIERLHSIWNNPAILALHDREPGTGINEEDTIEGRVIQQISVLRSLVSQNGKLSDELRKWRANLGGTYSFSEDTVLKGSSLGGAVRWQDAPVIGFPIIVDSELGPIRNVDEPIFGSSEYQLDLWLRHKRTLFDDKVNWTIQLNIRNVLDEDDLIDVRINYSGLPNIVRFNEGRRFVLSSTFDF
jgi:outer membrane receptor protein involved in Fe transport